VLELVNEDEPDDKLELVELEREVEALIDVDEVRDDDPEE